MIYYFVWIVFRSIFFRKNEFRFEFRSQNQIRLKFIFGNPVSDFCFGDFVFRLFFRRTRIKILDFDFGRYFGVTRVPSTSVDKSSTSVIDLLRSILHRQIYFVISYFGCFYFAIYFGNQFYFGKSSLHRLYFGSSVCVLLRDF